MNLVRGILLDIEGTTTPMRFVTEVLFPFARAHVRAYLERSVASEDSRAVLARLREEHDADDREGRSPPAWIDRSAETRIDSVVAYVEWLMDRDRKSTGLKSLQGAIWQEGYGNGALRGEVFPDVPPALERWSRSGVDVRIFSSGSILAQKLLFSSCESGDLTRFLGGFFDTTTGPKASAESYGRIASAYGQPPGSVLFVSDVTSELDAARSAGMRTLLCVRPGNHPQPAHSHRIVEALDSITV